MTGKSNLVLDASCDMGELLFAYRRVGLLECTVSDGDNARFLWLSEKRKDMP